MLGNGGSLGCVWGSIAPIFFRKLRITAVFPISVSDKVTQLNSDGLGNPHSNMEASQVEIRHLLLCFKGYFNEYVLRIRENFLKKKLELRDL
jgi:hypothetical protein